MTLKNIYLLLTVTVALISCKKEHDKRSNDSSDYRYIISEVHSDVALDLNFDGRENTDLIKEEPKYSNCNIFVQRAEKDALTDIIWVEPQINDGPLLIPIPEEYVDGTAVTYQNVSRKLFFSFSEDKKKILLGKQWLGNGKTYTLTKPESLEIRADGKSLVLRTKQSFLVKSGKRDAIITAFFVPASEQDVIGN